MVSAPSHRRRGVARFTVTDLGAEVALFVADQSGEKGHVECPLREVRRDNGVRAFPQNGGAAIEAGPVERLKEALAQGGEAPELGISPAGADKTLAVIGHR